MIPKGNISQKRNIWEWRSLSIPHTGTFGICYNLYTPVSSGQHVGAHPVTCAGMYSLSPPEFIRSV